MTIRCCVSCKHFAFTPEDPGYSELTPGGPMGMECLKNLWDADALDYEEAFRRNMERAETCPQFKDARA